MADVAICDPGGSGLFLPLFSFEEDIPKTIRGLMYLGGLLWMFMGVNIVADYFMAAVETITSSKKRKFNTERGRFVTVPVLNDTCANLTLLALGSSAPEILLSIIEMLSNDFYAGALGPSTIVGSAAFNLLMIIAVCIAAIPSPGTRMITGIDVYHVTVVFSIIAYMWLLTMCTITSPNIIEPWEGILTLVMMPVLVFMSYLADRGYLPFMAMEPGLPPKDDGEAGGGSLPAASGAELASGSQHHCFRAQQQQEQQKHKLNKAAERIEGKRKSLALEVDRPALEDGRFESLPAGDDGETMRGPDGKPIINPAGVLTFCSDTLEVGVGAQSRPLLVAVLRRGGSQGEVSCKFSTRSFGAIPCYDYSHVEGKLKFEEGDSSKEIPLDILSKGKFEREDHFQLVLEEAQGGALFNPNDDGGSESCILTVTIRNTRADAFQRAGVKDLLVSLCEMVWSVDNIDLGLTMWRVQILEACSPEAEEDEETGEPGKLGASDYVMHVLTLPFKVIFALACPPTCWGSGWVLFVVSLGCIAVVTACICDFADLFGCCWEIDNAVTAITVVALGTSLPDTFASMSSAVKDPDADASIVNVTGSNSVNVFLGIGIPWAICSLYWVQQGPNEVWSARYPEQAAALAPAAAFVVPAGSLGFSVAVYNAAALMALCVLRVRRLLLGGELGGPKGAKLASAALLVGLWGSYVAASIWRAGSEDAEVLLGPFIFLAFAAVAGCIVVDIGIRMGKIQRAFPTETMSESFLDDGEGEKAAKGDSEAEPRAKVGKSIVLEEDEYEIEVGANATYAVSSVTGGDPDKTGSAPKKKAKGANKSSEGPKKKKQSSKKGEGSENIL
eukprot:TRINITY_DN42037_c0_g1_i1.p1 TRINITY_DN42037_c0_g1~~TRINITY_DN42037_c0_g1_i1.p1  ORF type:complete len:842 (-),score=195.03 TRINITY_DN42037_c0_g1_i1:159-2684(-)